MYQHGMKAYGVRVMDREHYRLSNLHDECARVLYKFAIDNGINIMARFTEMGPATTDPTMTCDLTACGKPLGETP